ncbi:MAG: 50S ribosomal protein L10 [Candidatus Zambryskibacteria bacterium]|nr:50S ribosomal protein L10 [Candidatus Zambryskibacteria bacterium]
MAISKEKKSGILDNLKKIVKESKSLVFLNFKGLPVSDTSEIRKTLREKGVGYMVAKKTLSKRALTEGGVTGEMPVMPGEFAMVYGTDLLDPAREIFTFQKKFDKKIQIVGGVFEGKFMDQSQMTMVANIPGMKTLQAQFVNLINSPIQRFVVALGQIAEKKS